MTIMEDYLDRDPVLNNQKYVCLSILTASSVKDVSGNPINGGNHARGIKVRGCYATMEEAQKRCEQIRQFDKTFNVFVGEVGAWLPWDDDTEKAEEAVYAEEKLNQLMKAFKEQQIKAKEYQEFRKQTDVERAIKEAQKHREQHEVKTDSDSPDENIANLDETTVREIEDSVTTEKKDLTNYQKELEEKKNNISNISEELEKARKLYEELTKKVNENK
jgi:DNA repair exonuclease SbcCD ATPase subunit